MNSSKLIEHLAEFQTATQDLIDACLNYEAFIKSKAPFEQWPAFGLSGSGTDPHKWTLSINGDRLPSRVDLLGLSHLEYQYCTSEELITWVEQLPSLLDQAEERLLNLTEQARAAFRFNQ